MKAHEAGHPIYAGIELALLQDTVHPTALELVGGRIEADQLPEDPQLPAIRYALLTDAPHARLASGDSITADLQIDVYAHRGDRSLAWQIDAAVRRVFDRQALPDNSVDGFACINTVCVQRGVPILEPPFLRLRSVYRLFGSRA